MRLPSSKSGLTQTLAAQSLLAIAFLLLVFTQDSTYAQLKNLGIDSVVLEGVSGAFSRYCYWLIFALVISMSFTALDLKNSLLSKNKKIWLYTGMSFFLFYLILTRALQFPWNQDDAYIDFRYVINWLDGIGFDYNPGERAMGFTSHLHLALLSIFYPFFKSLGLPTISQSINIFFQISSFYLTYYLLKTLTKNQYAGFLGSCLFALSTYNIQETYGGKEAPIVITCLLVCLLGIQLKKLHLVSWFSSFILLTRPEGGLWMLLSMVWGYKNFKWKSFYAWIGPGLLLSSVAGWLFIKYGTIIPHSLIGKTTMFYHPPFMADFVLVLRRLADGCFVPELLFPLDPFLSYVGDFFRLYAGVLVLLAVLKLFDKGSLRFYSIAVLLFWLLFALKNPYLFPWYYAWFGIVAPLLLTIIFLKLFTLTNESPKSKNSIFAIVLIVYLAGVQIIQQPNRSITKGLASITFFWSGAHKRLVIYKEAAELANKLSSSKTDYLSAPEIGVLGHYYKGPILDLGGLVSDNILQYGPPSQEIRLGYSLYSVIPKSLRELKPRFLVTDGAFCKLGIWKDPWFKSNYKVVKFFPHQLWSDGIYLYEFKPEAAKIESSIDSTSNNKLSGSEISPERKNETIPSAKN